MVKNFIFEKEENETQKYCRFQKRNEKVGYLLEIFKWWKAKRRFFIYEYKRWYYLNDILDRQK